MKKKFENNRLNEYRELIEKELEQSLHFPETDCKAGEAMRYSALGGGKRIRGVLTLEFCRILSGGGNMDTAEKALPAAAAVEMIHAFSLIHDDLPCMDDDDYRRGKPSCHKQFGEASALLAGDGLLAAAFNTVASAAFLPKPIKPQNVVSVISSLSNATMEMIKGQQYDMDFEQSDKDRVTEEELLAMYNRKTCALISAACVCGAMCANASERNLHNARSYGFSLGLAFQITDDLLDLKTEKTGKKTLPLLIGEKKAREMAQSYTDAAVKIAENLPHGDFLKELALSLISRQI
ncbi:MAG: polyprenyl synthetase family protein [Oscillospiraceae bacterium]|nr:polyprenyl synthetase family protein [Oscillospiraceae bacterium]